jgi:acyl-CoA dehydrogenase
VRGERIGALAITEPDAGSDVAAVRTRAERVDGGWLVSGAKTFITNGVRADFYVTAVRTGGPGHAGLSFLVLERGEGVTATALRKLGWRASDTAELAFDEVFVPDEHLLGEEGRGFYLIMANFQWERLVMALGAVGAMRRTLERMAAELRGRGQAARHRVAELATRAEAGTALTYHALRLYLGGADAVREVTMAKLATQRANFELQDECLRLAGPDPELERAARDARLGPIGGGTDEIMREILGRSLVE